MMMSAALSEQIRLLAHLSAQDAQRVFALSSLPQDAAQELTVIHEAAVRFESRFAAADMEWETWDSGRRGVLRHALKNDLNLIMGFGHLQLRDPASPLDATQRDLLDSVCQRGRVLASLVNGLR